MTRTDPAQAGLTLIVGASGKTGRRVADRLTDRGHSVRGVSRSSHPAFDWSQPEGWAQALDGVRQVYLTYSPDLALPQARSDIRRFVDLAATMDVARIVLLSGRGEPDAQACERIVQHSGLDWTVVRASWFNQNFSEGAFHPMIEAGVLPLPAGQTPEPFIDVDDIADVAVAALTEPGHSGEVYEVTGPRLLTFADIAEELSAVLGRRVSYIDLPRQAFLDALADEGVPEPMAGLLDYLFATVLDGRNAKLTDGVQRALGRPPKDFRDFARESADQEAWSRAPRVEA